MSKPILEANRLEAEVRTSDDEDCSTCTLPAFPVEKADLTFEVRAGKVTKFDGGKVAHSGSIKFKGPGKTLVANKLTITPRPDATSRLCMTAETASGPIVAFVLEDPKGLYRAPTDELVLEEMDILVAQGLAEELGQPELAGVSIGDISLFADSEAIDGGGELVGLSRTSVASAGLDLSLFAMGSLSVATNPTGRIGTFPNGRNGLTMTTTACNVGTVNIPWNAPMQVTHPVIAMNLYRLKDGRFEQVGWSWLKHGFLSTNSNGCGSCQNPGTGSLLGINCSDTYGPGNNGDRTYLGGRDEVNPLTGVWTCQGSWFSNYINDCIRRNPGMDPLDAVDHRLEVLDNELGNTGAEYFYEACYILPNDINTYNNIGSRQATFAWGGSAWNISTVAPIVQGPAINRWGDSRTTAQPQTEGDVIVAVKVTDLGGGNRHYEYAVYNHNLDRQVREFTLPLPYGATVQNIGFHDIDDDPANDWTATLGQTSIKWATTALGDPNSNPLKYASVFNFRFDCNEAPASSSATMTLHKPGSNPSIAAATKGPLTFNLPQSYILSNALPFDGDLQSLSYPDDDKLVLGQMGVGSRAGTGLIAYFQAPTGPITQLIINVQSSNTITSGGTPEQTIEAWDFVAQNWVLLDERTATLTDSDARITLTADTARFVDGATREMRLRVLHQITFGVGGSRWRMNVDHVGVHFN